MRALIALLIMCLAIGCYHDKYDVKAPKVEEYNLPPNEPRYNQPDTATYRAPPAAKKQDTVLNRDRPGPRGLGGF